MSQVIGRVGLLALIALFSSSTVFAQDSEAEAAPVDVWTAASEGDVKRLRELKKEGVDFNAREATINTTPLVFAVIGNEHGAIRYLLRNGADPNRGSPDGNTPLHAAAFVGNAKGAVALIKAGADIFQSNGTGQTAENVLQLDMSTTRQLADFLQLEIDPEAVSEGRTKIKERLAKETKRRARDEPIVAVLSGDVKATERHLKRGANLNLTIPGVDVTLLSYASFQGHTEIVKLLLENDVDPNAANADGGTSMHGAAFMGRHEIVALLLKHGANKDATDANGSTPIQAAQVDWMTTEYVANSLNVPFDFDAVTEGKKKVIALLQSE